MNILLINGYSTKNRGDFGIVLTTINRLKTKYPKSNISIELNYNDMIEYKLYDVNCVKTLVPNNYKKFILIKYFLLGLSLFNKAPKYDLVISVGGGYLYSSRHGPLGYGLLRVLINIFLHSKASKTVIYPQTVGPIRKLDSNVIAFFISKIYCLYSRDVATHNWATKKGINSVLTNDTVFLNASNSQMICKSNLSSIGVTVVDHGFTSNDPNLNSERNNYLESIANFINLNFTICNIYVQVDYSSYNSDSAISQNLKELIKCECNISNVSNLSMQEIINLYSQNDMFLASRMHSAIYALCSGVETIGIGYQPKTLGMFELLGIPMYSTMVADVNTTFFDNILKSYRGKEFNLNINIWNQL